MKPLPKVSVVIPVYNVEKYLSACLESVIGQSYQNLEIICIDDGSTDGSLKILKQYAQKDHRISLITQKNAGVCVTRNRAIQKSTGDYICFIDSDDIYHPQFIEVMLSSILKTKADVAWCKITFFHENTVPSFGPSDITDYDVVETPFLNLFEGKTKIASSVVNKLYKTEKVKSILFKPDIHIAEDFLWIYEVFFHMKRGVGLPYPLYYARLNPNSATRKPNMNRRIEGHLACIYELNKYFSNQNLSSQLKSLLNRKLVRVCLKHICKDCVKIDSKNYLKYWKQYSPLVSDFMKKSILSYESVGLKNRIKLWAFCHQKFFFLRLILNL